MTLQVVPVCGLGEVTPETDLGEQILKHCANLVWPDGTTGLQHDDVVVITSKVISKNEGRVVSFGSAQQRDQIIDRESVRLVARRGSTKIVETSHGLILAAAGVDESNTTPGTLVLLPLDPDGSARTLRQALMAATQKRLGVIITDSLGRAWRMGITEHAIGASGIAVLDDLRGSVDYNGRPMSKSIVAVADQLAAAAGNVVKKAARTPVVIVRGSDAVIDADGPGAQALIRPANEDLFRTGSID